MVRSHRLCALVIFCLGYSCSYVLTSEVTDPEGAYISINDTYLLDGESFTLTCHGSSPGTDNYLWWFKPVEGDVRALVGEFGETYTVSQARYGVDDGDYVCIINERPMFVSPPFFVDFRDWNTTTTPVPEVLHAPSLKHAWNRWRAVVLTCESNSNSPLTYVFFKDDKEIRRSDSNTYAINPQPVNSGTYTCAVTNENGSIAYSAEGFNLQVSSFG